MQLTVLYPRRNRYAPLFNYKHFLGFCKWEPPARARGVSWTRGRSALDPGPGRPSAALPHLGGDPHQAVDRGAGEGGDIFGGQILGDGFIEKDGGLGGEFLVSLHTGHG